MAAPTCRPGLLKRFFAFLRQKDRCETVCGDWFGEEPPDIGVREPRRPRPGSGSSSIVLDPPL